MGRQIRFFPSYYPHEIVMRVKEGIPFPCWRIIKLLLKSAMARASRNGRVRICHFVWMGNHLHIIVVAYDAASLVAFYGELQKRLTDYVKLLSGQKHLNMWEGTPQVAPILDAQAVKKRIVYTYLNPARAGLVNSIDEYPGLTSWGAFKSAQQSDSKIVENVTLVRRPTIPLLQSSYISHGLDMRLVEELNKKNKEVDEFIIEPNAWADCFSLTEDEITQTNKSIRSLVEEAEKEMLLQRQKLGKTVMGVQKLCNGQFMKPHIPKKKGPKVFVLCSIEEERIRFILMVKRLRALCRERYKDRVFDNWPPGTFRPQVPPSANVIKL